MRADVQVMASENIIITKRLSECDRRTKKPICGNALTHYADVMNLVGKVYLVYSKESRNVWEIFTPFIFNVRSTNYQQHK